MEFSFRTAPQILFGPTQGRRAPESVVRFGRRVFFVTGARSLERTGVLGTMLDELHRLGAHVTRWASPREPDIELVDAGAEECRGSDCDAVLAVGGGSVLDAAKAIAALATNGGSALDYIEEVGKGRELTRAALPVVAVPTTAGSGSEVTRNSVLRVPHAAAKRSMRSDLLVPRVAIIDPNLSATAPRSVAAAAGMDALTHLIEAYVSSGAQPITDALALPGIRLALQALRALAQGATVDKSGDAMALASLWGGMALANAGLGAIHGLAAPIGGRCSGAHGVLCACLLPSAMLVNVEALRRRAPDGPALSRYEEVAVLVNGDGATPEGAAAALDALRSQLGIPSLRSMGLTPEDRGAIVAASAGGSMKSNPIGLTDKEVERILTSALRAEA